MVLYVWCRTGSLAAVVRSQLLAQIPGVEVSTTDEERERRGAVARTELFLRTYRDYPLREVKRIEADPMAGVLGSVSGLEEDESGAVQILLRPIVPANPDDRMVLFETRLRLLARAS